MPEQIEEEVYQVLGMAENVLRRLGFVKYSLELSTRDPGQPGMYMGYENEWQWAQKAMTRTLDRKKLPYKEMRGEAAFYGPKIDLKIVDASGRKWQCSTIQFDFNLLKRFNLAYTGADGGDHVPLMIHRVLLGAVECFFGILLEHHRGNLPTWLAPVQVRVLCISDIFEQYAREVHNRLVSHGVRSELDERASTLSYKIRATETMKIPYMVICGSREAESGTISVRRHGGMDLRTLTDEDFVKTIQEESVPVK